MTTLKQSIIGRCKADEWTFIIILTNGIKIEVNSKYFKFNEDFLEFDRIEAEVKIPDITNSGKIPRYVKIPYSAIAIFTEVSS